MATLNDVAKLAGVAPVTVSRVINDPGAVREETRERVRKAMAQLQYIPNMAARNLVTKRSGVIDIYLPESMDLSNPFAMHFISGISEVLSQHMYSLLILRNREHEHICDGYIVTGLLRNEIFDFERYAAERSRPVVLFGHTELPGVSCIDVDNVEGGRMGTRQLTELGHRRVAMINVAENKDYTADRLSGYQEALEEAGLPFRSELVVYAENSIAGGAEAAKSLLAVGGFSAVFCATDTVAVGAVSALADAGLRVPQDVSIVGFDGLGYQNLVSPRLTSVQQPIFEIGKMLASELLERISGRVGKLSRLVAPVMYIGASTAPPSGAVQEEHLE